MKHKTSSTKKIDLSLTTSPLLRFIKRKRRKRKSNINLGINSTSLETTHGIQTKPTKRAKSSKIVSREISKSVINDFSETVSIVQMPSTYKSNFENLLNMGVFSDSDNDREKFTSPKCLMATGNDAQHHAIYSDPDNSDSITINQVRNHKEQLHRPTAKFSRKNQATRSSDGIEGKCSITVYTLDGNISTANIYELNHSKYLVVLKPGNLLYFIGVIELELIQGSVEILGYNFNEQRKKMFLFSPLVYCYLFIKGTSDKNDNNEAIKSGHLLSLGLTDKLSKEILKEGEQCSIFILSRKKDHISSAVWPYFFESHLPISILSVSDLVGPEQENQSCSLVESRIGCILGGNVRDQGKQLIEIPEWPKIVEEITFHSPQKVILCGGKSVGKSTFLRYLINKLLKKCNKLLVLDFDPGQCEFTVPGCISVTLVEEPVLGPNFSHLKQPLRSVFIGEVDVTKCPEDYIEGCKYLIKYARKEHDTIPWLVNTMGFSKGFGVTLTCGIIQNVCPTNVIQIESKNKKFNFPSLLEPGFVNNQNVGSFSTDDPFISYNFQILPSAAEYQSSTSERIRGLSPLEARNLVILSYLSNMLNSVRKSLSQVTPYMINMEKIDLKTTNKDNLTKIQIASAMNGNLVALCSQIGDDVFPNCLGFGVVRGIDVNAGMLYLITPLMTSTLRNVNCLIKGNVNLPESLYYNQGHHFKGHIPYMAHTSGGSTALFAKRDYRILPTTSRQPEGS